MFKKFLFAVVFGLLISSCSDSGPTFDSSSKEAKEQSIAQITEGLSDSEKKDFIAALFYAELKQGSLEISSYDGLTSSEIIARYKDDRSKKEEREKAELETELANLREEYQTVKQDLSQIAISEQSYKWSDGIFQDGPVVSFSVTNNTQKVVTSLYVRVSAKSPGRTTPWATSTNPYGIDGGLEPGETRQRRAIIDDNVWEEMDLVGNEDLEISIEIVGFETSDQDEGDMFYHGSDIRDLEEKIEDLEEKLSK